MAKKGQKFKRYSIDLKRQVITEKLNLDTPIIELTNKYNISSQETVIRWIKTINYMVKNRSSINVVQLQLQQAH